MKIFKINLTKPAEYEVDVELAKQSLIHGTCEFIEGFGMCTHSKEYAEMDDVVDFTNGLYIRTIDSNIESNTLEDDKDNLVANRFDGKLYVSPCYQGDTLVSFSIDNNPYVASGELIQV